MSSDDRSWAGMALDAHLLAAAQGFDAVDLSPIAPLGVCASVYKLVFVASAMGSPLLAHLFRR